MIKNEASRMGDREAALAEFIAGSRCFDHCLQADYPPGLLDWIPPLEAAWSIRTHLLHVVDAELFACTRYRMALAQPGVAVMVWDEERWANSLAYGRQSVMGGIQVFKLLRSLTFSHLQGLGDREWDEAHYIHPTQGRVNLDQWLRHYVRHTTEHAAYVRRNEQAWRNAGLTAIDPHGH
jgi:hypothetical protein